MTVGYRYVSGNEKTTTNKQNHELKSSEITKTLPCVKVEIVSIPIPASFDTEDRISVQILQKNVYSQKKNSLISYSNLVRSKTVRLSPQITKLQI
jgi:hypothetical protein